MEKQSTKSNRIFLVVGVIITWFALVFQLYLSLLNRVTSVPEAIVIYFSYYTILCNTLIALCFTVLLLKPKSGLGKFFSTAKTLTAIAVYITVVGITYNLILRFTWNPQGLQWVVDELLHVVVPVYFILYWFLFAPKAGLQWKNVFPWLIFPFFYLLYSLFRGAFSGFYAYPFIDVNALGYNKVLLNSAGLFFAFLVLSLLFVTIAKAMSRTVR